MKGLILKDLLILKNQMRNILIVILGFILLSIWMENYFYIAFIIPFYIIMLVISTFSYDDLNNSNTYIVALPYDRKTIVKARYVLSLISIITAFLIGLILSLVIPMFNSDMDFMSTFASCTATILSVILVIALLMPFFYKFGVQKGRMILFIAIMGISLLIGIILSLFENSNLKIAQFFSNLQQMNYIMLIAIAIIIMLLILYISYVFSCKIYKNKEF
mgnify:FL=1